MRMGRTALDRAPLRCDICVKTALMAKQMAADGRTLTEIRTAVDRTFPVQGVPGTPTELPPS